MIIGIGCDIVSIDRIKKHQEALAKKVLTTNEYAVFDSLKNQRRSEYLAGRFAVKEAIIKAFDEDIYMQDIEILNDSKGKPHCSNLKKYKMHISISHEEKTAIAYAIVESI